MNKVVLFTSPDTKQSVVDEINANLDFMSSEYPILADRVTVDVSVDTNVIYRYRLRKLPTLAIVDDVDRIVNFVDFAFTQDRISRMLTI